MSLGIEYETKILTDYLTAKGMTKEEMFARCADNLDNGRYTVTNEGIWSSTGGGSSSSSHSAWSASSNPIVSPGHLTMTNQIKGDTLFCRACALKVMKQLIYQFREKDVDKADLPAAVAARPDCWWGKNCRTALCKPLHAEKLNHVCPQTRRA